MCQLIPIEKIMIFHMGLMYLKSFCNFCTKLSIFVLLRVIFSPSSLQRSNRSCFTRCAFTGYPCKPLHVPANGALVCDKLADGVYCAPQCERGLVRITPAHLARVGSSYFCSTRGVWMPNDYVGDCIRKVFCILYVP